MDDRNVIYRTDDPEQRVHWRRAGSSYVAGAALFAVSSIALRVFVSDGAALAVISIATVAFLAGYVIWRRHRNNRLTGSPTSWPES